MEMKETHLRTNKNFELIIIKASRVWNWRLIRPLGLDEWTRQFLLIKIFYGDGLLFRDLYHIFCQITEMSEIKSVGDGVWARDGWKNREKSCRRPVLQNETPPLPPVCPSPPRSGWQQKNIFARAFQNLARCRKVMPDG